MALEKGTEEWMFWSDFFFSFVRNTGKLLEVKNIGIKWQKKRMNCMTSTKQYLQRI